MDSNPFRSNDDGVPRWAAPWGAPWASVPRRRAERRAGSVVADDTQRQASPVPLVRARRRAASRVTPRRVLATSAALSLAAVALVITLSML